MPKLANLTDEQLAKRVAKQERRDARHQLQPQLERLITESTVWGKYFARPSQIRAAAKRLAEQYVSHYRKSQLAAA